MDSYKLGQIFRHVCMIHTDMNHGYMMAILFYEGSLVFRCPFIKQCHLGTREVDGFMVYITLQVVPGR